VPLSRHCARLNHRLSSHSRRTHTPQAEIKALLYQTMGIMAKTPVWGLALLAAGAGIGEEAFFRGFLQSGFQQLALRTDVAPAVVRGGTLFHFQTARHHPPCPSHSPTACVPQLCIDGSRASPQAQPGCPTHGAPPAAARYLH
jgi:hypothetical protein